MQRIHIHSDPVPHSWDLDHWPEHVYPHSESRARWLLRGYRQQLIAAGALSRVGREIIFLGRQYARWLEVSAASKVADYVPRMRTGVDLTPLNPRGPRKSTTDPPREPGAA